MTSLQSEDCQTNDLNDLFPMSIESLRFPLHKSMQIIFTGYYNGFNVEIRSGEEMSLLHQMGCFGKGSASRSRPLSAHNTSNKIMRKRQYQKRNYWYKKFKARKESSDIDTFLKEVDMVTAQIIEDGEKLTNKEVIDLVSSDDDMSISTNGDNDDFESNLNSLQNYDEGDLIVIVPNSDSEEDNYFADMTPKCCVNKVVLNEKLMLSPEEAFFLLYGLGRLQIINLKNDILSIEQCWEMFTTSDENFAVKYIVYHYFRSKGYVVKPGIKFGGDYLLYREGPEVTHADFIVVINSDDHLNVVDPIHTLGLVRIANTTIKQILIAHVTKPMEPSKMPHGLKDYRVQEILLSRNIPVAITEDD